MKKENMLPGKRFAEVILVLLAFLTPMVTWGDEKTAGGLPTIIEPIPSLKLKWIPAGAFVMGSPKDESGRHTNEKEHLVTLSKGYWIGVCEVTQGQWKSIMQENPSHFQKGDNYPVENITWVEAQRFCDKLNELTTFTRPEGYVFALPSEAQWEFAARAGTTSALNNGKNLSDIKYHCDYLNEIGWYDYQHQNQSTHPVGQKKPNAWGLYDMHGNVSEWCNDWWGSYHGDAVDPNGPQKGSLRDARGGSWGNSAQICRSAYRSNFAPDKRSFFLGLRLALVPVKN